MKSQKSCGSYILITPFFPTEGSFRGSYIYDQAVAIRRAGLYDKVLIYKPKSIFDRRKTYIYGGFTVRLFPHIQMPSYILNGLLNKFNGFLFTQTVRKSGVAIDSVRVAHAHVSTFAACGLALKKYNHKIKVLVQHHDRDPFTIRNGKWANKRWNARFRAKRNISLFNAVDCHVSISEVVEDNLLSFPQPGRYEHYAPYLRVLEKVKELPSISPKHSIILNNGVDLSKFHPIPQNHKGFVIGCIGNFVELKDQITLIKAVELLVKARKQTDIQLLLIGTGPLLSSCQQYVVEHSLYANIAFKPEVEHGKLPRFYHSLDLFVLTSCYEGFGCVFTEAYACGVPFITCRHQGAAECICDQEADKWLIDEHDFVKLSELIMKYRENRYEQHLCKEYDIDKLIPEFLRYIETL